jgi:hypothetical protein
MDLSKASIFKPSSIYGIPNLWGVALFSIIGMAGYFSITHNSAIEKGIFIIMILLVLIHLIELNKQFRHIHFHLLSFDFPFAKEQFFIPIKIVNPHLTHSHCLLLKFKGTSKWKECPAVQTSQTVYLPFYAKSKGMHFIPELQIRMKTKPHLFLLWQYARSKESYFVLAEPIHHGIHPFFKKKTQDDFELSHIEAVRDPRLFFQIDQKLFQKTGKPYRRIYKGLQQNSLVTLRWADLKMLNEKEREEQFCYWIKQHETNPKEKKSFFIDTPFFISSENEMKTPWPQIKKQFADWLNEKH